ncbi:hypothetical protein chiPu_0025053 [Chiloscyllium punctatum]|uniref:Uncharacterized protein n=1 Tax=Chiloscyllium punctatum TaxID=137246 RepID=A0A401TEP0_CHIPU|nr:hypothetical protein [Chiloscyllium punctatum]
MGLHLHATPDPQGDVSAPTRDSRPPRRWVCAYTRLQIPTAMGLGLHMTPDPHGDGSGPTRDSRPPQRWVWAYT